MGMVACGGRSVTDGSTAHAGESAGGSTSFGGASSGGANPVGGADSSGGSSSGASAACLNSGQPPDPQVTFSFESDQPLWLRYACDIDYTLTKLCEQASVPIQPRPQNPCSQKCDSGKCLACTCDEGALQVDQIGGPVGPSPQSGWNGYMYTAGVLSSGCACDDPMPAGSGTYAITVTAFLTREDALAQTNGYPFTTLFQYPSPSDVVHVRLDFKGL